jgi:hypothetical protein
MKIKEDKMEANFEQQQRFYKAQKKVKEIKGFYTHLVVYCLVIPVIIFVNLKFTPQFFWFWFSVFGWGLGLFFHWLGVFGFDLLGLGKNWEEKKIREIMDNDNK